MTNKSISHRLFDAANAQAELEELLEDAAVPFKSLGWDSYDYSIEICGVPGGYRLSVEAQMVVHTAGFIKAYVNHEDKWETHYNFNPNEEFVESKGWRVSYPHKRGENEKGIWLEEPCPTWPKDWFESGFCIVKAAA